MVALRTVTARWELGERAWWTGVTVETVVRLGGARL